MEFLTKFTQMAASEINILRTVTTSANEQLSVSILHSAII